jgi:hypothetical protein
VTCTKWPADEKQHNFGKEKTFIIPKLWYFIIDKDWLPVGVIMAQ